MIEECNLQVSDLGERARVIPDPEPVLQMPDRALPGAPQRILPVAETLLAGNEGKYLAECVNSNWISSAGRFVGEFEARFSAAVGCSHGVACASGTAALHLALATLGVGPGDEVIVPAFAMIAVANAVTYCGARPVFVDSEPDTGNLDVTQIEAAIGPSTRALIVVHTYGHAAEMEALLEIARRRGIAVVEDAAEAHGGRYRGQPVGSFGDLATFSFYGNKIISTGEGGMVTTRNGALAAVARRLRDHAFSTDRHFWHKYLGYNYRMTNLQAAVGLAQTERMEELVAARKRTAAEYSLRLSRVPGLLLPGQREHVENVYWMYAMQVRDEFGCSRDELRRRLAAQGIETRTFFVPIHLQPIYFEAHREESYPVAEELCRVGLYLPSAPTLTVAEIAWVSTQVERAAMR
jgi:perosamine synthetase